MRSSTSSSSQRRAIVAHAIGAALTLAAVTTGACLLLSSVFQRPNWKTMAVDTLSTDTRTVFMGTSTFYFGIDPRFYPNSVNLSTNYANCRVMHEVWTTHASKMPNVRLAVLESNLSSFYYDTAALDASGLVDLGLDTSPRLADFRADFDAAVRRLLRPIFAWRLTPYFFEEFAYRTKDEVEPKDAVPGYVPSKLKLTLPGPFAARELDKARQHAGGFGLRHYEANVAACAALARELARNEIRVSFLRMPREAELRKIYPPEWDAMVEMATAELARRVDPVELTVIDQRQLDAATAAQFRDPDHLNSAGAARLAAVLGPLLESMQRTE